MKFTKMQGLGNDYVYLDCTNNVQINDMPNLAKFVSNRNFGIGSDGLILICNSDVADFKMIMFNQDGSQAQMCGNGIRCVGKFVYDKGLTNKTQIEVETLAGIKQLELNVQEGEVKTVKVDMGTPILKSNEIPVNLDEEKDIVKDLKIDIIDKVFSFTCISVGNPHAITFINNVKEFDVEKYGKIIEIDSHFPEKTNVEFIELIDQKHIKMRVWERGSGETLACGTGATASVVACILNGYTQNKVDVDLLGGTLMIEWNRDNNHIYMTGPAQIVFEGDIKI